MGEGQNVDCIVTADEGGPDRSTMYGGGFLFAGWAVAGGCVRWRCWCTCVTAVSF